VVPYVSLGRAAAVDVVESCQKRVRLRWYAFLSAGFNLEAVLPEVNYNLVANSYCGISVSHVA
jgi:hypothetical protein